MASICSAAAGFLLPMWTTHSRSLPVFVLAAWPVLPRRDVAASFVASPLLLQGLQGVPVTGTWGPSLAEPRGQCHQGASTVCLSLPVSITPPPRPLFGDSVSAPPYDRSPASLL